LHSNHMELKLKANGIESGSKITGACG
jgi:hypothetical protein